MTHPWRRPVRKRPAPAQAKVAAAMENGDVPLQGLDERGRPRVRAATVAEIAAATGLSVSHVSNVQVQLRKKLGWQAH